MDTDWFCFVGWSVKDKANPYPWTLTDSVWLVDQWKTKPTLTRGHWLILFGWLISERQSQSIPVDTDWFCFVGWSVKDKANPYPWTQIDSIVLISERQSQPIPVDTDWFCLVGWSVKDKANPYSWTLTDSVWLVDQWKTKPTHTRGLVASILLISERQSQSIPVDTDWFCLVGWSVKDKANPYPWTLTDSIVLISERQSQPIPVDTDWFYCVDQWKTKPTHTRGHWLLLFCWSVKDKANPYPWTLMILFCWSVKDKANPYPWTLIDSILLISERQSQPIPVDTDDSILLISERQSQPIPVDTDWFYFVDQWKTKPTHIRGHWLILFFVDQWKTKPTHTRRHWLILFCWSVKDKANPYPWTLIDSVLLVDQWKTKPTHTRGHWLILFGWLISERQSQPLPVDTDWFCSVGWSVKDKANPYPWTLIDSVLLVDQWKTKPTHTRGHRLILLCWSVKDKANPYPWTLTDSVWLVDQWKTKPTHTRGHWLILFGWLISERQSQPIPVDWLLLFCWSVKDKANPYPWTLIDSVWLVDQWKTKPTHTRGHWLILLCWSVKDKANPYLWTLIDSIVLISERQSQPIPVDTDCFYFVDQWKTKPTHTRGHWLILFCWSVKDKSNPYPWTLIDSILLISERQSQPIPVDTDWFYCLDKWKTKPTHTRGHWLILLCWSVKNKANPYPWTLIASIVLISERQSQPIPVDTDWFYCVDQWKTIQPIPVDTDWFYFVDQWKTKPTHTCGHWLILLSWSVKDKANPYPWTLIDSIVLISERQIQPITVDTDWFYFVDQWKTKPTHTRGHWLILFCWSMKDKANPYP